MIATRPEISLISTMLRFYQMNESGTIPRATAAAAHDLVVQSLPENLDVLRHISEISRITIWNREQELLFDSKMDRDNPSFVLRGYWRRPWSEEEVQMAQEWIAVLREKELQSHLGQNPAIDEIERRISTALQSHAPSMDLT